MNSDMSVFCAYMAYARIETPVYCGLSGPRPTAPEVFQIFTTQIYSLFMNLECTIEKELTKRE